MVMETYGKVFSTIDDALISALPRALTTFQLWEGAIDLAVHAPMVRYLVKQSLALHAVRTSDEDDVLFNLQRVSNCGLCVDSGVAQIRVLKATPMGLPKVTSEARQYFVQKNQQLTLRFGAVEPEPMLQSLGLFVAWRMDHDHKYLGIEIACPRRTRDDGSVECYWVADYGKFKQIKPEPVRELLVEEEDLKIIRKKQPELKDSSEG